MILYGGGAYVDDDEQVFVYVKTVEGFLCRYRLTENVVNATDLAALIRTMRRLDAVPELYQKQQDDVRTLVAKHS